MPSGASPTQMTSAPMAPRPGAAAGAESSINVLCVTENAPHAAPVTIIAARHSQ